MKKLLISTCTILFMLACNSSYSQPVITHQQLIIPNTVVYRTLLDTTQFNPGQPGANILWDFSSVNIQQLNSEIINYQPANGAGCFNDTTINVLIDNGLQSPSYRHVYYISDTSHFGFKGYCHYEPPMISRELAFYDYQVLMKAPFSFQENFSDSSAGSFYDSLYLKHHFIRGRVTLHYDAWGELRLPWGTYTNVARIREVTIDKDSIAGSVSGNGDTRITESTGYKWYDMNTRGELLFYSEGTSSFYPFTGAPVITTFKVLAAQSNLPLYFNELSQSKIQIYPNPSDGIFHLTSEAVTGHLKVYNPTGQVILEMNDALLNGLRFEIKERGVYVLEITRDQEVIARKILISHAR